MFFLSFAELKETVRKLEEWLKEAEVILKEPLRFNQKWTQEAIDVKKKEIQVSPTNSLVLIGHPRTTLKKVTTAKKSLHSLVENC